MSRTFAHDLGRRLLQSPQGALYGSHPATIAAAALSFAAIFGVLQASSIALPRDVKLPREHRLEWNIRVVSVVHALVLVSGSYFCWQDSFGYNTDSSGIFGYSFYPDFFARVFLGYLIYDLSNLSVFFKTLRDYSGIIHHCLFIYVTAYVLAYSLFKQPFVWLSFGEASTPFVNFRWALAVLGKKHSTLYLANGIALALTFFLARVVAYGLGLAHLWRIRHVWWQPEVPPGHKLCIAIFMCGYVLNLYWFWQITRAIKRAFSRHGHSE